VFVVIPVAPPFLEVSRIYVQQIFPQSNEVLGTKGGKLN